MLSSVAGLAILLIAVCVYIILASNARVREYIIIIAGINLQCCTRAHDYIIIMCAVCAVPVDGID